MVLVSWGNKSKKIADASIMKCRNCNNYSAFEIRELANNIGLFFVSIIRWSKKTYLVCPVCNFGYELSEERKNTILQETVTIPNNKISIEIWNKMDLLFADHLKDKKLEDLDGWIKKTKKELSKDGYSTKDINHILSVYAKYISEGINKK